MKYIVFAVLIITAIISLLFGIVCAADPEGRGGSYTLLGLFGFVALVGGAIAVAVKY